MVVSVFPGGERFAGTAEVLAGVASPELFLVDPMAAFDFAVLFGAPWADVAHADAQLLTREGEEERKLGPVVPSQKEVRTGQLLLRLGLPTRVERSVPVMTSASAATASTGVAIDVAKLVHQVLIDGRAGRRRTMRIANTASKIERLVTHLQSLPHPCVIAFEPTGDYHRALMHRLGQAGFTLRQVSSLAVARTRDAMYNSWDKNNPKDAQVILHLLKTGTTQRFVDPLVSGQTRRSSRLRALADGAGHWTDSGDAHPGGGG